MASDYELPNNREVRQKNVCVAAIPQSATLTAPFTQRGPCAVRQCVPFPLAAQVRQWGQDMPQNGQITFQTFPWKWGKIATAGRGSPRGEAERKVLWALGAGGSNVSRKQGRRACILLPKLRQSPDRISPECEQSPHMVLAEFPQSLCRACAEFAQSFTKVCWKLGQVC